MPFVRRYKDLGTDLDGLYRDIIKELQHEKDLEIVKENYGIINGVEFKSVTAVRANLPRAVTGTLREVTVSIGGTADDWLLELHTGSWFGNMLLPGAGGFLIAGPVGSAAAAGTTTLMAAQYGRKLKNQIKELVKKNSGNPYTADKVETFID
jgi:hypothetical protein